MSVRRRAWRTAKGEIKEAWIVDYTDQHGERHIETHPRKKDADARHIEIMTEVGKGVHRAPSTSITVAEAGENWIARVEAEGRERSTVRQYRQHLDLHIKPRIGSLTLARLTPAKLEWFRDDLLSSLSRELARKVLTSTKSLLKNAKASHLANDVSIGRDKRGRRKLEVGVDIPLPDEARRIIAAANGERIRALLLTVALTGLRASELRGLRWVDVDLKSGELHVRQRADRFNEIGPPKTKAGTRSIPLPAEAATALKVWKLKCPPGEHGLVFPSSSGAVDHHKNMLRAAESIMVAAKVVAKVKPDAPEDAKPEAKYGLHSLRHFFASWCINPRERGGRELPAKVLQELMGHSSIVITLDLYSHLFPRRDDRAELAASARALLG